MTSSSHRFGRFELRPAQRSLLVDGRPAALGARAFDMLVALIERRDRVVSSDELFELVWPGLVVEENNLRQQVAALRKLLGAEAVVTVPRRGYRFALPLNRDPASLAAPAAAPAVETAGVPNNLPLNLPALIGREDELGAVTPATKYASSGGVSIAYQVVGDGRLDLVLVPGWVSNLDAFWEEPATEHFLRRLASFSRLILFDKRGTGLSDRVVDLPPLEVRMDDLRAVLDAVGSEHAALFGYSEGGSMCALFAASYPERTSALIMAGSYARMMAASDYSFGRTQEQQSLMLGQIVQDWGGPVGIKVLIPSRANDARFRDWWAHYLRASASPQAAALLLRMSADVDIRHVLPSIRVPTLVLHSVNDKTIDVRQGRYLAEHIAGAKYVELQGPDHAPFSSDSEAITDEIEEFLTGVRHNPVVDRVLATVLFTEIVGATEKAAELGDRSWSRLVQSHHQTVRRELGRFRGREIDAAGDGFFAAFDGPARAIRCACAISRAVRPLGIEVRAGLHTGECEVMGEKYGGIAVHIGARVAARAHPGEVLVSSTVKDLVAGSDLAFNDRGVQALKGVPGDWHLFAVAQEASSARQRT
jgi:pimeloyl-ACP methyl ester carboxylesterase/DNA-binding winged helix-turn-helix (wHTH) protein